MYQTEPRKLEKKLPNIPLLFYIIWLEVRDRREEREMVIFKVYIIWLGSLYCFNKLYVNIKNEMLGELSNSRVKNNFLV